MVFNHHLISVGKRNILEIGQFIHISGDVDGGRSFSKASMFIIRV